MTQYFWTKDQCWKWVFWANFADLFFGQILTYFAIFKAEITLQKQAKMG